MKKSFHYKKINKYKNIYKNPTEKKIFSASATKNDALRIK